MAAISLSAMGVLIVADAAAIAVEIGGAATTANVTALGNFLQTLGKVPSMSIPVMQLTPSTELLPF